VEIDDGGVVMAIGKGVGAKVRIMKPLWWYSSYSNGAMDIINWCLFEETTRHSWGRVTWTRGLFVVTQTGTLWQGQRSTRRLTVAM